MKVLVIGAAGGFGGSVAEELLRRGHSVRALMRPGGRVPALPGAEVFEGDALDLDAMDRAAAGMDAIVWGFHLPYHLWVPGAVDAARITAEVAARHGATVLFPGNVYGLGAPHEERASEQSPKHPRSRLGEIRNEMEGLFEAAAARGARTIVLRSGDYFGPRAANTWFEMMAGRAVSGARLLDPGGHGVPHAWAYLPDVARAGADLLERRETLAAFDVLHFQGFELDTPAMLDAMRAALGDPRRGTFSFPWWAIRVAAPFSPLVKALLSMRYLWQEPVLLDGTKLRRALPQLRSTPLADAVATTFAELATARGIVRERAALPGRLAA